MKSASFNMNVKGQSFSFIARAASDKDTRADSSQLIANVHIYITAK